MSTTLTDAVTFYSSSAETFHDSYTKDANRLERVRVWQALLDRYGSDVRSAYDLGCGSGILVCELARRGIETVGIDGSAEMLAIAARSARQQGYDNVQLQRHKLPIDDTSGFRPADLVISSSALEYLDSMEGALAFVRRLTRPGGVAIFSVSNHDSLSRKAVRLVHRLIRRPRYLGFLKHFMTVDSVKAALRSAELEYVEHAYFARADRINRILGLCLPARFCSNMIIVVARRADRPD